MQIPVPLNFISDDGHGWLQVPRTLVARVHMLPSDFSEYSYCDAEYLYLEEDCDAGLFMDAAKARDVAVNFVEVRHHGQSPIRAKSRVRVTARRVHAR
jgi:hypothetical protein